MTTRAVHKNSSYGLWVDLPKRVVLTPEFFSWFSQVLHFDQMSLMIDDSDRKVDFSWGPQDVEASLELASKYLIDMAVTTWPYPDAEQLRVMMQKMDVLLGIGEFAEWETDQEFNWEEEDVSGFSNLDKAGDYLVKIKQDLCEKHKCRNTLTTLTYHVENSSQADTSQHMDRLLIQGYAIDERDGKQIVWGHKYAPGNMEPLTLNRTLTIPGVTSGKPEIGIGHAAWAQDGFQRRSTTNGKWVLVPPEDAMRTSFYASLPFNPVAHNWWSAKYVYPGSPKFNTYAEAFLKSLRADPI